MFRQGGIKMKAQTLIFTICVVSLFLSCSKKQSVSKIEIAPSVPAETVSVQTKIPESSSKDVVFFRRKQNCYKRYEASYQEAVGERFGRI